MNKSAAHPAVSTQIGAPRACPERSRRVRVCGPGKARTHSSPSHRDL